MNVNAWDKLVVQENSKPLENELASIMIEQDEMFLSHDVVSLFTNTPINETLDIIKKQLEVNTKLKLRTNLNVDDIIELLKFIVTTNILASGAPFISRSLAQQWEVTCNCKSLHGMAGTASYSHSTNNTRN